MLTFRVDVEGEGDGGGACALCYLCGAWRRKQSSVGIQASS